MTAATTSSPEVPSLGLDDHRPTWRARRQLNRQLRLRDGTSARLAELDVLASILRDAAEMIRGGWLQHSWFAYRNDSGQTKTVTAYNVNELADHSVVGACLVGAIVEAGGGLSNVRTQPVQRALDLTWYTLFETVPRANHRTPAPAVRTERVRDLTRWNDNPHRTARQAETLLRRSAAAAVSEATHLQSHAVL